MAAFNVVKDALLTTLRGNAAFGTANCDYLNELVFLDTTNRLAVVVTPGPVSTQAHLGMAPTTVPLALTYSFPTSCYIDFINEATLETDTETAIEAFVEQLQGDITMGESTNLFSTFSLVSFDQVEVLGRPWIALDWDINITTQQVT